MQIEIAILIIFGIWLAVLTFVLYIYVNLFNRLTKGTKEGNLKTYLESLIAGQAKNSEELEKAKRWLAEIDEKGNYHIQKLGLVRFNPFEDLGGDHSFSLAILDGVGNGMIITSLHSRERTRIYMKKVTKGKSDGQLSAEEKEALSKAM